MSILNDEEIKALCVCPDKKWVQPQDPNHKYRLPGGGMTTTLMGYDAEPYEVDLTEEEKIAFRPMITPFVGEQVKSLMGSISKPMSDGQGGIHMVTIPNGPERRLLSYGLSSFGYDVRLSEEIKIFSNINSAIVDPKRFDDACLIDATPRVDEDGAKFVILPPNSYMLGRTEEYFDIPRDILVICVGKSTYARAGVIVNVTPIEPGFKGNVVLEASNATNLPVKVYLNEGLSQFAFFRGNPCKVSYGDRGGKYQGQVGVTRSKV
ncbi:MAG TPA: dCTP deaminase [Dongiaceae bacterium]|nr:dCTP deaminase [Dongiaceae bacterium]